MSRQRPSVMPQSISLRTGHADGRVTQPVVTQQWADSWVGHNHDTVSGRESDRAHARVCSPHLALARPGPTSTSAQGGTRHGQ